MKAMTKMIKISIAPKPNMVLYPYGVAHHTKCEELIRMGCLSLFTEPSQVHRASLRYNVIPAWVGWIPQAAELLLRVIQPASLEVDSQLVEVVVAPEFLPIPHWA